MKIHTPWASAISLQRDHCIIKIIWKPIYCHNNFELQFILTATIFHDGQVEGSAGCKRWAGGASYSIDLEDGFSKSHWARKLHMRNMVSRFRPFL